MTSFFPDLNIWLALSVAGHVHEEQAWRWYSRLPDGARVIFCRYTQLGLLRLLMNKAAMGAQAVTLEEAWAVYDHWRGDRCVEFHAEPRGLEGVFRGMTAVHGREAASKWISDCYLLAHAHECGATLVTFDRALLAHARKRRVAAILPE